MTRITFLGGGNMATSIIGSLIGNEHAATEIMVTDQHAPQLDMLNKTYGVQTSTDNAVAADFADVVIIAVKPNIVKTVCLDIKESIKPETLIVSVAAGVPESSLATWLEKPVPIVRCMPNTPALLGLGATALFANLKCSESDKHMAEELLSAAGVTVWVEHEQKLDTVTSLSGSGPAYFFYLIECMTKAAIAQGLPADVAETLAIETAFGAASMARARDKSPATLRENVTSKGGTTAAALASYRQDDLEGIVARAMRAAETRADELGKEFGA